MKKYLLQTLTFILTLLLSVNTAWGQEETPSGQAMYLAAFKAQPSPESTGSGTVKLTWIDAQGKLFGNSIVSFLNLTGMPEGYQMPYATGNPSNGNEFAENALMVGTTMTATESVEESSTNPTYAPGTFVLRLMLNNYDLDTVNIFMTPYAYFKADAQGDAGSYFEGWTFNDARVWQQDTAMDKSASGSAYFKVLPNPTNIYYMAPPSTVTGLSDAYTGAVGAPNNIYAVFKKYLLSNPTATSGMVAQTKDASKDLDVYVDVEGDMSQMKADHADFATPSFSNVDAYSSWECDFSSPADYEVISATKRRYRFVVTYTALEGITEGKHSATLTIRMAGASASSLDIPVSVMARPESANDASVKIGNAEPTLYGTLSAAVNAANSASGDVTLTLLRNVSSTAIELSNTMTLDLNGYTLSNTLTVNGSGKTVTLVYNKLGGEISGAVLVSAGTLVLNGGKLASLSVSAGATVEQNGATITDGATNAGTFITTEGIINGGLSSTAGTLTLNGGTFNGENAVTVSGGTADINRGTLNGSVCGLKVTGGTVTTKKLAVINSDGTYAVNRTAGTLNVESGKFGKPLDGTINFTSGFFTNNTYGVSIEGKTEFLVSAGTEYTEGYRYFLGDAETAKTNGVPVCRIGTVGYAKLEDALAYANNNPNEELVIFMTNDYTLPAGYYTLPAKATIVVPMSDTQAKEINYYAPRLVYNDINAAESDRYENNLPTEFRRLTLASGVNMDVFGDIELTCTQFTTNAAYTSQPVGAYGRLVMEDGSHMTLQNGSELRAWGFMTGKGETDARRGATVREMFQMGDWKGAMTSVAITGMVKDNSTLSGVVRNVIGGESGDYSDKKIFPVSQYFIQNVESPVKYHPGALLTTSATVSEGISMSGMNMSISMAATDIAVVGVSGGEHTAIFLMDIAADAENTWVRKWYDAENDIQVYDINSGAHIGSMELDMGELSLMGMSVPVRLNSGLFDLPITSNFKIHLLSGTMDFKQNTCLLPGSEVEVDKESTVTVAMNDDDKAAKEAGTPDHVYHSGAVYVYDQTDWDRYAYNNKFTKVVRYAPSALNGEGGQPNLRSEDTNPASAKINVHGTFNTADGYVYTSVGGANIYSSNEDAGTFIFSNAASEAGDREVWQIKGKGTSNINYMYKTFTVAKLKNGDNSYTETSATGANQVYMYKNDEWHTAPALFYFDCFTAEVDMDKYEEEAGKKAYEEPYDLGSAVQHIYIKPQEWVEIVGTAEIEFDWSEPADYENDPYNPYLVGVTGNSDHTYSDADGAGRLFILMSDACQWWEVEKKDNLYHCIHPNNDTYYYWDEDEEMWMEKKFTITWKNWDGSIVKTADADGNLQDSYKVTYGTMAEFLGTNPTREKTIDYTYDFTGWSPALGPVTSNVTYTATYEQKDRMYTVTFLNEGGTLIETQFLKHNDVPVCENMPTKIGHTLIWSPAIAAVTGDATYTATFVENPPTEYEVTFYDYDGTTVLKQGNVAVGETPTAPAIVDGKPQKEDESFGGKPATNEFTYVFDHWSPALEEVSATSIKSYTAVYAEVAKTYTIKFVKENGDPDTPADIIESHQYQYGETPICANTPTKDADAQYTYALRWTPQIQTVMADANYTAVFDATLNKYTVSVMSNPSGACAISGAGIYDYSTAADAVTITITPNSGYDFTGWSDGQGGTNTTRQMAITGDINLVANFTVAAPDYTITWKSEDGNTTLAEVGQKANTATIYTGEIPTKDASAQYVYTFDGWTTEANGAGTFYKNNMTPKATADETYYAHFAASQVVLEVGIGLAQNIAEATTVNQLILNSNGTVSGQLTGANLLNVTGACYYDLTGTFTAGKWFAVAVPWQVTAGDIRANGNALSWMSGDYLAYYDGFVRAAQGKVDACWKYLRNNDVLVPGRLYMLYLANDASVLRFPKKAGAPILNASTSVSTYAAADATNANWNGIANPAIFYAYLSNTGATVGQVFNADAQSYTAVALRNKLIVAKPIFVQATNDGTASAVTTPPAPAPLRRNASVNAPKADFQVEIAAYGKMQDRIFIHTNEDKAADTYTVGQDLVKMGVSTIAAQMWVNRYNAKLCMNTIAMVDGTAEYPLNIFVPNAGEYTITNQQSPITNEDYTLYLTYNGYAIWNLSEASYTASLPKGTINQYGLRVSRNMPGAVTAIDEASANAAASDKVQKVLINDVIYIIREGKVYDINGHLVK